MPSSDPPTSVFITGSSGYIGGAILARLLQTYPSADFFVQYRQDSQESELKSFSKRIKPVKASLSDHAILEEYSAKADVVITAADCDDLEAAKAVIKGLESAAQGRLDNKQRKAVLIHTSGTGVLCDPDVPAGELDPTEVHDGDAKQIAAIPESRPHREVDIVVTDAFKRGHFLGYIVLPSTIFGRGNGPIHTTSQQIPNAVNWALSHQRATYVEPGKNLWANVEIGALADLYLKLTQLLLSAEAPPPPHDPWTHYIFAATAKQHSWKELVTKVGDILKALGELEEGGAQGIDAKDYKGPLMGYAKRDGALQTTNSRAIAERAKELVGWEDTADVYAYLEGDIKDAIKAWKASA